MPGRARAVDGDRLAELINRIGISLLFHQDQSQVKSRTEIFWFPFKDQFKLFGCRLQLLELEVLYSEVVSRHEVIRIDINGLLEVLDCFEKVPFTDQLRCSLILFSGLIRRSLVEINSRN